jgi:ribonucleotide monophosphatase NagD (HAD superfamily)
LGIGPFIKALESATGIEAKIIGKPTSKYFEMAVQRMKGLYPGGDLAYEDIAVVGDDIENDLGEGSISLGTKRILGESLVALARLIS